VSITHCYVEEGASYGGVAHYVEGALMESSHADGRGISGLSDWHAEVTEGAFDDEDEDNNEDEEEEE
jgi:hypothetical protein